MYTDLVITGFRCPNCGDTLAFDGQHQVCLNCGYKEDERG